MFKLNKLALISAALVSTSALAGVNGNDFYIGAGVGQSYLAPDRADLTKAEKDRDAAIQAFMGYEFTDTFGLEASYADLGDLDSGNNLDYNVTSLQMVVSIPSNSNEYSLYGKLGGSYIDVGTSNSAVTGIHADYDTVLSGGLGVRWNMNENWFARAEYNLYGNDLAAAFVQVAYSFGGGAPVVVPVEETTEEPVVIYLDDTQNISAIFNFGSAEINDTSRLDEVVSALEGSNGNIVVKAHTDSTGPAEYNQRLSEQRAQSAVDYFVSQGIEADRFVTEGLGETQPIASNETAEGRAQNRRVEVEYTK